MNELLDIETGKVGSQVDDDPAFEEFDLLGEDDFQGEVWPRSTAYVSVGGRYFRVRVDEIDNEHDYYFLPEDLENFILGVERFVPRTPCEEWLDEYLVNAEPYGAVREDVMRAGAEAGFSPRTVGRAAKSIGVRYQRKGFGPAQVTRWHRS